MAIGVRGTEEGAHGSAWGPEVDRQALAVWPRLGRRALRRCGHDPRRVAALVSRRTSMPPEVIVSLLTMPTVSRDEAITWFG
jgi:hypothetical protein